MHRSNSGRDRNYGATSRGSARGKEISLNEKSSLSALIGDNLKESNFLWHGEESFKSTEHQFFYEDFQKDFDGILKENKQPTKHNAVESKLTDDEKFRRLKKEISGSVNDFKKEMDLIIGENEDISSDSESQGLHEEPEQITNPSNLGVNYAAPIDRVTSSPDGKKSVLTSDPKIKSDLSHAKASMIGVSQDVQQ